MKKLLIIIFLSCGVIFPQFKQLNYRLQEEIKSLSKISDDTPASNTINDILIVGDTVWIATSRGLSKSTDQGLNWTNYYQNPAFGTESVSALAYDKATHSIWCSLAHSTMAGGQSLPEGSGLRFSTNGGTTWKTVPQPIDAITDTIEIYGNDTINALPVTVKIQNISYDVAITPNVVWIASFAGGLRKNRIDSLIANPTSHWSRVILPPDNKYSISPTDTSFDFCLSPASGKYCSTGNLNHRVFSLAVAEDSILYVGTANGINKTTDALKAVNTNFSPSWTKYNHQQNPDSSITGNFVVALHYESGSNPKTLWAATWKAEDANESYGVSFSQNGGKNWQKTLVDNKVYNFANYQDNTVIPADNGLYRTSNFGATWLLAGNIVDSKTKSTLQSSAYYSACFSEDGKALWIGSGEGLARQVQTGNNSWTSDWQIFFASQKLTANSESYAFPNPYSPKTDVCKIKYSTGGNSQSVTIRIFNFGMKPLRTVIQNAQRGNPTHSVNTSSNGVNGVIDTWDGKDDAGQVVPNGVYFYRIDVGSNEPVFGKIMVLQ